MTTIATLGIDIGKRSFHVIGRDENEKQVKKAKYSRKKLLEFIANLPPCLIAMEGCAGAHWLGRKCKEHGHEVKLIPAQFVKPYVKSNKNDFIDADAICEAVCRPQMRFITLKTEQQQIISAWCRVRESYVVEKTAVSNKIHAFFLEFGVSRSKGKRSLSEIPLLLEDSEAPIPDGLREIISRLYDEYKALQQQIKQVETRLTELLKPEPLAEKLMEIHGVGLITTALLIAKVGDGKQFKNGRELAAWIGLVPRQYSTGGKDTLLGISKRGDSHLRRCLIHGARSIIQWHSESSIRWSSWLKKLQSTKPANVVCVAMANKLARIVWAVMVKEPRFQA